MAEQICADKQITDKEFAESIDISPASLSQLRSGQNKSIKADWVRTVCEKYKYSILWVITGKGEMRNDNKARTTDERLTSIEEEMKRHNHLFELALIPLIHAALKLDVRLEVDREGIKQFLQERKNDKN